MPPQLDQLFYHTRCDHCISVLKVLHELRLDDQLQFVRIDRRYTDPQTRLPVAVLDNGLCVPVPVNVIVVPTLLFRSKNNTTLTGAKNIIDHFRPPSSAGATADGIQPAGSVGAGGSSLGGTPVDHASGLSPIVPETRQSERIKEGSIDLEAIKAQRDIDLGR